MDHPVAASGAKHELRSAVLAARRLLSDRDIAVAREAVRQAVLAHGGTWRSVAAFEPLRTELASIELLDALVQNGIRVIVPVLLDDRDLDWARWETGGRRAVREPPSNPTLGRDAISLVDAALVPALGVDKRGFRLGRGGGSYDRALRRVPPGIPVAALIYEDEFVPHLPADAWDVPVTAVVTPAGWVDV